MTPFHYCPNCASKLGEKSGYPHCNSCDTTYYRNAKPCASILPIKDGKVLLARRGAEPYKGAYDIIGGFLNEDELPEDGALREALEETGLTMKITGLLGMYIDRYGEHGDYTLNIHYLGEITEGDMEAKDDVEALEWVEIEKVPLDSGFQNTRDGMRDLKAWYKSQ